MNKKQKMMFEKFINDIMQDAVKEWNKSGLALSKVKPSDYKIKATK